MTQERKALIQKFIDLHNLHGVSVEILHQALTHKSFSNEIKGMGGKIANIELSNQRLEFLGDAILGLCIARTLYDLFPDANEGELTKRKSMAVCEPTLAEIGENLEIGTYLLMGKGELQTGGVERASNIADALEAIIAGIYLSAGLEKTMEFIVKFWIGYLEESQVAMFSIDHKSKLQEFLVKTKKIRPEYKVLSTSGPEHSKTFLVALYINGQEMLQATSNSRKKAEQKAAYDYLKKNKLING
ncbi:MAG: ribonuclease III [Spirochaetia bacterium]|nr:ribonuclease III [Spirochaetia bacterium]